MNATAHNFAAAGEIPNPDGLPMPRATLEQLERARGQALAAMLTGFDALAAGFEAAQAAAVSFASDAQFLSDKAKDSLLAGNRPRQSHRREDTRTHRDVYESEVTTSLDRSIWRHVIEATDLEKLMDRQAREELEKSLYSETPPAATVDNIVATLFSFLGEAPLVFRRGVANAFAGLDRRFRSHDGFKIGGRVILDRFVNEYGSIYGSGKEHSLRDIERAFSVLDGKPHPEAAAGIVGAIREQVGWSTPRPIVIESDWVRVRIFKNGNAHLWFTRDDLVRKVNRVLADYYGEAIGEGSDVADTADMGPGYHLTPARDFGYFPTSEETAEKLFDRIPGSLQGLRILEPSAGKGALADKARRQGATVHCVEIQHGFAAELRQAGHAVTEGDFLQMTPTQLGQFDGVIMNPPFDRGRDCDHVRHALQFVKPGGWLVAIMSAGAEFREDKRTASLRALIEKQEPAERWGARDYWRDLPPGSFAHAGTNVNTVTLAIRKPL